MKENFITYFHIICIIIKSKLIVLFLLRMQKRCIFYCSNHFFFAPVRCSFQATQNRRALLINNIFKQKLRM